MGKVKTFQSCQKNGCNLFIWVGKLFECSWLKTCCWALWKGLLSLPQLAAQLPEVRAAQIARLLGCLPRKAAERPGETCSPWAGTWGARGGELAFAVGKSICFSKLW